MNNLELSHRLSNLRQEIDLLKKQEISEEKEQLRIEAEKSKEDLEFLKQNFWPKIEQIERAFQQQEIQKVELQLSTPDGPTKIFSLIFLPEKGALFIRQCYLHSSDECFFPVKEATVAIQKIASKAIEDFIKKAIWEAVNLVD